jgi:hypothetical protein
VDRGVAYKCFLVRWIGLDFACMAFMGIAGV